jgi:hypothetical protein
MWFLGVFEVGLMVVGSSDYFWYVLQQVLCLFPMSKFTSSNHFEIKTN